MKPVNLNQLLFHPKSESLTFFLAPLGAQDVSVVEPFLEDMVSQLKIQDNLVLAKLLEKNRTQIKKILRSHPLSSHGFFLASDLAGYVILNQTVESFCLIGRSFHLRPLLEELFVNPEFMLVNISLYDLKVYRGDFQHLEIVQQYEFDQLPKNFLDASSRLFAPQYMGLVPYKTILALKALAHRIQDQTLYQSTPVIITGIAEMKSIFLRYFEHSPGVISHYQEDFYEKTCAEILEKSRAFRNSITDYYSLQLKERLKRLTKSRRFVSDLSEIIRAAYDGKVIHLVIPPQQKLWGKINPATGEFVLHRRATKSSTDILNELAEEVMRQGGRIQILAPHFFPQNTNLLAILKG